MDYRLQEADTRSYSQEYPGKGLGGQHKDRQSRQGSSS